MRKLILKMSMSVDGFVGGPNGEIDWIFKSSDAAGAAWTIETLWNAGVHIMGSRTFKDMAAYWPTSTQPFAPPMNEIPKIVFSRQGTTGTAATTQALQDATRLHPAGEAMVPPAILASWANPVVASGNLAEEIARLKREPGKPILAHGGASFARALVQNGLVDEYRLLIHPVALGRGLPLFCDLARPLDLKLLSATAFEGGAAAHVYQPV